VLTSLKLRGILRIHRKAQMESRVAAGEGWVGLDLVFTTRLGSPLDAANVRRAFRRVAAAAGLDASAWTPRELRGAVRFILRLQDASQPQISSLTAVGMGLD
jgi:hypothetical protein